MQHLCLIAVACTLVVHHSDALVVVKRAFVASESESVQNAMSAEAEMKSLGLDPEILVRPHAGQGVDTVKFGLRAMNFYGTDMKHHTYSLDMVMTCTWHDRRAIALIPEGLPKISMAREEAEKLMWMPGIIVSNRDIEMYEIISASVTIYRTGEVRRVERANTRVMKRFLLQDYPFDVQNLALNIASSKYMLNEVILVPDDTEGYSGVEEAIWGLYDLENWTISSYEAFDGDLKKSRGTLNMRVARQLDKYGQDHLLPGSIVLAISCAVFYFPFANPFITARLMLSILSLLTFTNLIIKSTKELPGAAPFNWNDLLNQQVQFIMFIVILINIASEIWFHTFKKEDVSRRMNNEAKVLIPLLACIEITIIMTGGMYQWITLQTAAILCKVTCVGICASVFGFEFLRIFGVADKIENSTPRSPRKVCKVEDHPTLVLGEELPLPYAVLTTAVLTIAVAHSGVGGPDEEGDCDM